MAAVLRGSAPSIAWVTTAISSKTSKVHPFYVKRHLKTSRGCRAARLHGCGAAARLELLHDKDASNQQSHSSVPSRRQQEAHSHILTCILHTSHQVRGQPIQPETVQPGSCFLCQNKSIFLAAGLSEVLPIRSPPAGSRSSSLISTPVYSLSSYLEVHSEAINTFVNTHERRANPQELKHVQPG